MELTLLACKICIFVACVYFFCACGFFWWSKSSSSAFCFVWRVAAVNDWSDPVWHNGSLRRNDSRLTIVMNGNYRISPYLRRNPKQIKSKNEKNKKIEKNQILGFSLKPGKPLKTRI